MKAKKWMTIFLLLTGGMFLLTALMTAWLDPFFVYRAPREGFYYTLSNERAQNAGIVTHFSYDALITGTSMTQNFRTGEAEALFEGSFVKVSFSGATFKERADLLRLALDKGEVRLVISDAYDVSGSFLQDKDYLPEGFDYPAYLYNDNPLDDVKYLLNRDVLAQYVVPMIARRVEGGAGGITPFDEYGAWAKEDDVYGREAFSDLSFLQNDVPQEALTEEERQTVRDNVEQNLLAVARAHPETTFYYFIPPYSVIYRGMQYGRGELVKQIEAEEEAVGMLLGEDNIRLYSFAADARITCDLANYKDMGHYGPRINTRILEAMAADDAAYRITAQNAEAYIRSLSDLYLHYNYEELREMP